MELTCGEHKCTQWYRSYFITPNFFCWFIWWRCTNCL